MANRGNKSELPKDKRMIILYVVPISLWPMLGKKKRFLILGTVTIMTVGIT